MPSTYLEFLEGCMDTLNRLPRSFRIERTSWLIHQLKTGPVGRRILGELQYIYFLRFLASRVYHD